MRLLARERFRQVVLCPTDETVGEAHEEGHGVPPTKVAYDTRIRNRLVYLSASRVGCNATNGQAEVKSGLVARAKTRPDVVGDVAAGFQP